MTEKKRALVVGLGIAGMSTAISLKQAGWTPLIIEKSPVRRTGGYFIGLFSPGRKAALELGVMDAIHTRTPSPTATWQIDNTGTPHRSFGFLDQSEVPDVVLRGDVEAGLWSAVDGNIEVRFGTRPTSITQHNKSATVVLEDVATGTVTEETFDLVIGADGLRSTVRSLAFGPHEKFMQDWKTIICAFQFQDQVSGFSDYDGLLAYASGRALWVFPFADRPPTGLFIYRTKDVDAQFTRPPLETIRSVFADMDDPAVKHGIEQLSKAQDFLFDSVHMVEMPAWVSGRVIVTGDAAWCLTLTSSMGTSAAILGGAELGKALAAHPEDIDSGLQHWEQHMRPFIQKQRRPARVKRHAFVPPNRIVKWIISRLMLSRGKQLAKYRPTGI